jgi:4-amino-4-deoxy-L-arabinose transferase-like glycosyltransferase
VVGFTVLAAALRFATLNVQSVWLDEAVTMLLVHKGFFGMLSHLPTSESAPPLYYIGVWGWTRVFGATVLGFRSFSALIGTVTIPVVYAAGRRTSPRVGLWAAALATVNPMMFYDSQEARCYALLILLCAIAFVLWQRALASHRGRDLAWWAVVSSLALLTHYFAAFMFVPEAIVLGRRLGWRRIVAPAGTVVVVGAALAPLAIRQRSDGQSDWIQSSSLLARLAQAPKDFLVGLYSPSEIVTASVAALLAAGAVALLVRRGNADEKRSAKDIAVIAVWALALPALLAATHIEDVFNGRNVIAAWTPCSIIVAVGLGVRRSPRLGNLLGAGLCAISLLVIAGVELTPGYQRDDWRGAARSLSENLSQSVVVGPQFSAAPLAVYLPKLELLSGPSLVTREIDFVDLRTRRTGRSPAPPVVLTIAPPGFRASAVRQTETFAVSRFTAAKPTLVSTAMLRRLSDEPKAEIVRER